MAVYRSKKKERWAVYQARVCTPDTIGVRDGENDPMAPYPYHILLFWLLITYVPYITAL